MLRNMNKCLLLMNTLILLFSFPNHISSHVNNFFIYIRKPNVVLDSIKNFREHFIAYRLINAVLILNLFDDPLLSKIEVSNFVQII